VIADTQVSIILPSGAKGSVPNPLYGYTFHPIDPSFPQPYNHWKTTLRHPQTESANATTDVEDLTEYVPR
jgi:tyrosinase